MMSDPALDFVRHEKNFQDSKRPGCPLCAGDVERIPRRPLDFFKGLFSPLRRYRCLSMECGWVGNLREKEDRHPEKPDLLKEKEYNADSPSPLAQLLTKTSSETNDHPSTVLLVEDDPEDARLIREALGNQEDSLYRIEWVTGLSSALKRLAEKKIDVILLDLTLPDGDGINAFDLVFKAAPNALILVLSSANDKENARLAVRCGAHDYLEKNHVDAHWLPRALRYVLEAKSADEAVRKTASLFRAMSDASPLGIFVSDEKGHCVYTNASYQKISGLTFERAMGTNWSLTIHPEDRQRVLSEWHEAAREQRPFQAEVRFLREDKSIVWTRLNSAPMQDEQRSYGHVQTIEDITDRKMAESVLQVAEESLFEEKERAQVTLNSIGDAVLTTGLLGNVTYLNLVAETLTGWSQKDALGRHLSEVFKIIDGTTRQIASDPVQRAIEQGRTVELDSNCVLIRRDGSESSIEDSTSPIHNREGEISGAVIVFHDSSESRSLTLKMSHLAQYDFLTGLPNRVLMEERLSQAIQFAHRYQKQVALLFLDLDYFKNINDSLGHSVGDQLLQSVSKRLTGCVRTTDTICRQGGDEFVILLSEVEHTQDVVLVAEKLLYAFSTPHFIGRHELHVTLSIGISIYPDNGVDTDTIMQNADTAMYHAKSNGRNSYQFFRPDMNIRAVHRLFIESSLRRALNHGEFLLHYQPKIDLVSGIMTGTEALIRWQDRDSGLIYPGEFVSIAEECGLIVPIGQWVMREACEQHQKWLKAGLHPVPVAVNISAMEFRQKSFVESVALILKETGLPPGYLELEMTESILMYDAEDSALVLKALKTMGIELSIDDFGTGYSSLSYLRRFPIDTLKIDQSFILDIPTDKDSSTIVSAVIGMGRNLHLRVTAEGVETQEQLAFLRAHQCDEGQGFLFSHPLINGDLEKLLSN